MNIHINERVKCLVESVKYITNTVAGKVCIYSLCFHQNMYYMHEPL